MRESVEKDQPFFLQLSHYAVHSNIVIVRPPTKMLASEKRASCTVTKRMPPWLKILISLLVPCPTAYESLGLADNTYLIFTADNGGMPVLPMQLNLGRLQKRPEQSIITRQMGPNRRNYSGATLPHLDLRIAANSQTDTPVVTMTYYRHLPI